MGKHYVPQEYLRGFSPSDNRRDVWMFDKVERSWSCPAIKQAAQTGDYYPADVERRLAQEVEGPGHLALKSIREGNQMTRGQRSDLAYYIAVLIMRGPRKRRKARELVPRALQDTMSETRSNLAELRTPLNSERIDLLLSEVERIERQYRVTPPSTVAEQIDNVWPSPEVVAAVEGMAWRVARMRPDRFLFTTDNPAYFFESYGVGSDLAELTFPIDPATVLLGSHQGEPGSTLNFTANAQLTKEVNRRMAAGAERFIFSPRKSPWIETLALRQDPYLSRIEW